MGLVKYFSNTDSHAQPAPPQSPLHIAANILRTRGMQPDDMRIALTSLTVMYSAYLQNPLSLLILDNTGHKVGIVDSVMKMVPQDRIEMMTQITQELIFHRDQPLKGRCLIVNDNKSFNKMSCHFDPLLGRGITEMKASSRTKYGSGMEKLKAEGPVSCIVFIKKFKDCALTHPYILRVNAQGRTTMNSEHLPVVFGHASQDLFAVDAAMFKKNMELLKPSAVHVPFAEDLAKILSGNGHADRTSFLEVIQRLLVSTTLINNIKAPSKVDTMAKFYDVDETAMANWLSVRGNDNHARILIGSGQASENVPFNQNKPLIATKYDYYLLWVLLNGVIVDDANVLTGRQNRVFTAIRNINIQRATGRTFAALGSNTNILLAINRNPDSWTGRDNILKEVNQDGGEELSLADIENDLKHLLEGGVIEGHRPEGKRDRHYHIMVTRVNDPVMLPHPSTIMDPVYKGQAVDVINPITGKTDTI